MFLVPLLIGLYSYVIFFLGIIHALTTVNILALTFIFVTLVTILIWKNFSISVFGNIKKWLKDLTPLEKFLLGIVLVQILVNLIGVLGPETGFDALWYHLTLPKIFLQEGKIFHISGGLFYYSDMPKLVEMLYIPVLVTGFVTGAKFIHFLFGLGTLILIYKLSRKFISPKLSLLAIVIFYSNLVVGWQSITAYVDLGRTFFEIFALFYFLIYIEKKNVRFLIFSSICLGLAITTKLFSGLDIATFLLLALFFGKSIKHAFLYVIISLIVPLPWFIFSYVSTKNPFYPFFSGIYPVSPDFHFSNFLNFLFSADPISPVYLITFPIVLLGLKKMKLGGKILVVYSVISFIIWFLAPQSGGGRFIMAYLPTFSVLVALSLSYMKDRFVLKYSIALIIVVSIVSIVYRGAANMKYTPVILGIEPNDKFLTDHLNFSFGDFYDIDGYFKKNIKKSDKVLVYNVHNLYYADFPFVDSSWYKKGDFFNYVLIRGQVPNDYQNWKLKYQNIRTSVKLYSKK